MEHCTCDEIVYREAIFSPLQIVETSDSYTQTDASYKLIFKKQTRINDSSTVLPTANKATTTAENRESNIKGEYVFLQQCRRQLMHTTPAAITSIHAATFTMSDIYRRIKLGKFFKSSSKSIMFARKMRQIELEIAMNNLTM